LRNEANLLQPEPFARVTNLAKQSQFRGAALQPAISPGRIPTLVIYGDHEFIPAATAAHITQAMPNAHMVTLKDCGHFSYLECPAAVRELY